MNVGPDCQASSNNCTAQPARQFQCWQQSWRSIGAPSADMDNKPGQSSSRIITSIISADLLSLAEMCQKSELVTSHGEGSKSNFSLMGDDWWRITRIKKNMCGDEGSPQNSSFFYGFQCGKGKYGPIYVFNTCSYICVCVCTYVFAKEQTVCIVTVYKEE